MLQHSLKPYIDEKKPMHLIGIGGVIHERIAELLLSLGVRSPALTVPIRRFPNG